MTDGSKAIRHVLRFAMAWLFLSQVACIQDSTGSSGATRLTVRFDAGPDAGKPLSFLTDNSDYDLRYYRRETVSRVFCQPLHAEDGRKMLPSASVNFAWRGDASPGTFTTVNFQDSLSAICGTIDLNYADGESLLMSWPAGAPLDIVLYGSVGTTVEGHAMLSGELFHEKDGLTKRYPCHAEVEFSIHRGPDGN